jgi:hypothetical protein
VECMPMIGDCAAIVYQGGGYTPINLVPVGS